MVTYGQWNAILELTLLIRVWHAVPSQLLHIKIPNWGQFAYFWQWYKPPLLFQESPATYDDEGYVGFGFDGWQSGVQSFPDISQVNEFTTNYLPRSFPVGKLEKLLTSSLHELEHAISVEKKN